MKDKKFNPSPLLNHPDKDEIISKFLADFLVEDIREHLHAKYPDNKQFHLSKAYLTKFKDEYLDLYCTIKSDLQKTLVKTVEPDQQLQITIQSNKEYQDKLQKYLDNELDIQTILRKAIARVEYRVDQIYEETLADPKNLKPDRILREWMTTLLDLCEKFRPIVEGPQANINIQQINNIQIVDKYVHSFQQILQEVVAEFDHETSLAVIERFSERMSALKEEALPQLPQEERMENAKILSMEVKETLSDQ